MQPQLSEQDLAKLIPEFYARVRADPVLGPVFNRAIADWDEHLEKLQAFWSSIMLTSGRYKGHPLAEHIKLGDAIERDMFQRWLALWRETTAELLAPDAAAAIQLKAERMAERLTMGIEMARGGPAGFAGAAA